MWGEGWCVCVCVGTYMCKQTRKWQVSMMIKNACLETRYNVTKYEHCGSRLTQKQRHRSMRQSKCNAVPRTPRSHMGERYYNATHSYTWLYMSVYVQLRVPSQVGEMMTDRPEKEVHMLWLVNCLDTHLVSKHRTTPYHNNWVVYLFKYTSWFRIQRQLTILGVT